MVTVTAYLYPWDLIGDPEAIPRLRRLGVRTVALAAVYHAVRAATPRHPEHRQVTLPRTTVLVPAVEDYPEGLVPDRAPQFDWRDAAEQLRTAGIEVWAWVVLTHVDGLVARADSHRVDAFGDVLDFALCPSSPRARAYIEAELSEVMAATGDAPLVLEAVAAGGWQHSGVHDKASDRVSPAESMLLSQCFCDACTDRLTTQGVDVRGLAARIRAAADPIDVADVLGADAEVLHANHLQSAGEAVAHVLERTGTRDVALHATAGAEWYTGPAAPVDAARELSGVTLVASAWDSAANATARISALRAQHPSSPLAAYVPLLGRDAAVADVEELLTAGVQSVHLYHVGLMNARESAGAARVIAAIEGFVTKGTGAKCHT